MGRREPRRDGVLARRVSADFFSLAFPVTDTEATALVATLVGTEVEYNGNVYCDVPITPFLAHLEVAGDVSMCPNFPALVAIDRFAAEPIGAAILQRRAYRCVKHARLPALIDDLARLTRDDLARAVAQIERGDNGWRDVEAAMALVTRQAKRAQRDGLGLLMVCLPM